MGKHNVLSRVKSKQPGVFSQGSVCHLDKSVLLAGVKALPVDVDDFFVDLFYFFNKSATRKEEFHEFQKFPGTKELKIIKRRKTRWLSLDKVVQRVLHQWSALHAYFDKETEDDTTACVARLDQHFKSLMTKLVMLFLEYALKSPCKYKAALQSSLPMLPSLKAKVKRMLRIFLGRFIKAAEDISKVKHDDAEVQLPDS